MTTSRFIFAAVSSVGFSSLALASDCNTIVAQLVAGVPGLNFTSTTHRPVRLIMTLPI